MGDTRVRARDSHRWNDDDVCDESWVRAPTTMASRMWDDDGLPNRNNRGWVCDRPSTCMLLSDVVGVSCCKKSASSQWEGRTGGGGETIYSNDHIVAQLVATWSDDCGLT